MEATQQAEAPEASAPSWLPGAGGSSASLLLFGPADYAMFAAMMALSALVGVYYGCYKRQDTVQDYLLGGKAMAVFPVSMSLVAR